MTLSSSIGPFDITQHPSKKTNPYCARFRQVAALQKRANQLTAEAAKPFIECLLFHLCTPSGQKSS